MSNDLSDFDVSSLELVSEPKSKKPKKLSDKITGSLGKYRQARPTGRPTSYREEYPERLIKIANDEDVFDFHATICATLKISRDTLWRWSREIPAFSEAYAIALDIWRMRLAQYTVLNKMDYRLFRCFTYMAVNEDIEPKTITQTNHLACIIPHEQLIELNHEAK